MAVLPTKAGAIARRAHSRVLQHLIGLGGALAPDSLLRPWHEHRFFAAQGPGNHHGCLGKFATVDEARAFAHTRECATGYRLDHPAWLERQSTIHAHDYPVLFWLDRLLSEGSLLVDLGGSVGVSYYAFRPWLRFPDTLRWMVCELPEPVALGREIALNRGISALSFTEDHGVIDGCDVLLSSGTLQFLEDTLAGILAGLTSPPLHVLINRIVLSEGAERFVTLQNTGLGIAVMRVDSFDEFCSSMQAIGYEMVDCWKCLENMLWIPQHPECRVDHFFGFHFRRTASHGQPGR